MADIVKFPGLKTNQEEYSFSEILKNIEAKMEDGSLVKDKYVILAFDKDDHLFGYINEMTNVQLVYLFERLKLMYI